MDTKTARSLSALTTEFYRRVSASFSDTRRTGWPGWETVLACCDLGAGRDVRVLDLACGNLRFERFLAAAGIEAAVWAVDNCDELAARGAHMGQSAASAELHYQHLDLTEALYRGSNISAALEAPRCDLSVSFGFMHHLPLPEQRAQVLRALVDHTLPGGHIALSFWQFAHDERIMAKACAVDGGDAGDYLLGWQGQPGIARYCHSFAEAEVDALASSVAPLARECARYSADGKSGDLNRYLVLERL